MTTGQDIPPTRSELLTNLTDWLREFGSIEQEIATESAHFEKERQGLQAESEDILNPLKQRRQELWKLMTETVTEQRSLLLHGKHTKQLVLPTGKISWRKVRGAMQFLVDEEEIKAFLAEHHISHLAVRIKRELMKSKINRFPSVGDRLERAGLIRRGDGEERLFIEPLAIPLDTPDTGTTN